MIIYSIYGLVVLAKDTYEIPPSSLVLTITQEVLSLFIQLPQIAVCVEISRYRSYDSLELCKKKTDERIIWGGHFHDINLSPTFNIGTVHRGNSQDYLQINKTLINVIEIFCQVNPAIISCRSHLFLVVALDSEDDGGYEDGYEEDEGHGDQEEPPLQPAPLVPPGNLLNLHLHRLLHCVRSPAQSCPGLLTTVHGTEDHSSLLHFTVRVPPS